MIDIGEILEKEVHEVCIDMLALYALNSFPSNTFIRTLGQPLVVTNQDDT